jgi:hypothetical protein
MNAAGIAQCHIKDQRYSLQSTMTKPDEESASVLLMNLKYRSVTPEASIRLPVQASYPTTCDTRRENRKDQPSPVVPPSIDLDTKAGTRRSRSLVSYLHSILNESQLVSIHDRELVPDYLLVALAQMMPCQLTDADKIGCYRKRELGFTGMRCKHCGGMPGFARFFPASVRSLAQTTTSHTIVKHVGSKCENCPEEVRNAVLSLQKTFNEGEHVAKSGNDGKPRYGSRKVFFQRVWNRLHISYTHESGEAPAHSTPQVFLPKILSVKA